MFIPIDFMEVVCHVHSFGGVTKLDFLNVGLVFLSPGFLSEGKEVHHQLLSGGLKGFASGCDGWFQHDWRGCEKKANLKVWTLLLLESNVVFLLRLSLISRVSVFQFF